MNRKDALYKSIVSDSIPDAFLSMVGVDGGDCLRECELLDYKEGLSSDKTALAKTVRHIVGFHNTYGGYLVYGVKEGRRDTAYHICGHSGRINLAPLRGAIDRYTGMNIGLSVREFEVPVDNATHKVTVLAIPRRDHSNPVHFIKTANDHSNSIIFRKNETVFRDGDRSRTAMNGDDFELLFSPREYPPRSFLQPAVKSRIIQHNLPDRNLICPAFIGREEIISELWSWLADDFEYIKVLAGEGGRGKTSIAYEFSEQIAKNATNRFDLLLWLSAKERQFEASQNTYISLPEVHFDSTETLLNRIIEELGVGQDVGGVSLPALKRSAIDGLRIIPTFVVVDNLDTMDIEEQRELVEAVRQIADRSQARILLTTRSNVSMPIEQCVEVPGLQDQEYREFVRQTCASYGIVEPNSSFVSQMLDVSDGSPIFTQSILRLIRLGQPSQQALKDWQGMEGLAVRSAALQREIEQLAPESRRVLYALALVRSASYQELRQITDYDDPTLRRTLDQLSSLFLIHAPMIIESERRFEIPESTARLIVDLKDRLVNKPYEINARVRGIFKSTSKEESEVGKAIRQSMAFIREGDFVSAVRTVQTLIRKPKYANNADLFLMKGRVLLASGDLDGARVAFKMAYDNDCRKDLLFELWLEAEVESSHYQGMYEVCDLSLQRGPGVRKFWVYRRAEAKVGLAAQTIDVDLKLIHLRKAADDLAELIPLSVRSRREKYIGDSAELHDLIWQLCRNEKMWNRAYLEMIDCIERGDTRGVVFHRAIDCVENDLVHTRRTLEKVDAGRHERRLHALNERLVVRNREVGIADVTKAKLRIASLLAKV